MFQTPLDKAKIIEESEKNFIGSNNEDDDNGVDEEQDCYKDVYDDYVFIYQSEKVLVKKNVVF